MEIPKWQVWTGRVVSALVVSFLVFDGTMKVIEPPFIVQANAQLGYPESEVVGIGVVLLACVLLYAVPRTAVLGAILLTGHLGGAIASQVRVQAPVFNVVFAAVFAVIVWLGLWLRDERARQMLA
jgi:DoxX-like protein